MRKLAITLIAMVVVVCTIEIARAQQCAADIDTDGDGIFDAFDNCMMVANADQRDTDNDGYGNACDPDIDNDGVVTFWAPGSTGYTDLDLYTAATHTGPTPDWCCWDQFPNLLEDADFNGDGVRDIEDGNILMTYFSQDDSTPPGPSCQTDINRISGQELNAQGGVLQIGATTYTFDRRPLRAAPTLEISWVEVQGPSDDLGVTQSEQASQFVLTYDGPAYHLSRGIDVEITLPNTPGIETFVVERSAGMGHLSTITNKKVLDWFLGRAELRFSPERRVYKTKLYDGVPMTVAPAIGDWTVDPGVNVNLVFPRFTWPGYREPTAQEKAFIRSSIVNTFQWFTEDVTCVSLPNKIDVVFQAAKTFIGTARTVGGDYPKIYLPPTFITTLSPDQKENVLAHEVAHAMMLHLEPLIHYAIISGSTINGISFLDAFWPLEAYAVETEMNRFATNKEWLYAYDDTPGEDHLGKWPAPYSGLRSKTWPSDSEPELAYAYRLGDFVRWLKERWDDMPTLCEYTTHIDINDPLKGFDPFHIYRDAGQYPAQQYFSIYVQEINMGLGNPEIPWEYDAPIPMAHGSIITDLGTYVPEGRTVKVINNRRFTTETCCDRAYMVKAPRCEIEDIFIGIHREDATGLSDGSVYRLYDTDPVGLIFYDDDYVMYYTPITVTGTGRLDAFWAQHSSWYYDYRGCPDSGPCNAITEGLVQLHTTGDPFPRTCQ